MKAMEALDQLLDEGESERSAKRRARLLALEWSDSRAPYCETK